MGKTYPELLLEDLLLALDEGLLLGEVLLLHEGVLSLREADRDRGKVLVVEVKVLLAEHGHARDSLLDEVVEWHLDLLKRAAVHDSLGRGHLVHFPPAGERVASADDMRRALKQVGNEAHTRGAAHLRAELGATENHRSKEKPRRMRVGCAWRAGGVTGSGWLDESWRGLPKGLHEKKTQG